MRAEKANKVYTIEESQKDMFIGEGYDIYDDEGNVIAYGKGKTVSYDKYMEAVSELEKLKGSKSVKKE